MTDISAKKEALIDWLHAQAIRMMEQCPSADSLATSALEYKFGPDWVSVNQIDTTRLIGEGGIGKVYAGIHNGLPVAYKVINQLKTPDAMLRFVRKCVLPIVNVQMLPTFPSDHPHLLQLYDCLMFPQYYSLLAIKQGAAFVQHVCLGISASFLAEISVKSSQILFIFIIYQKYLLGQSIQKNVLFKFENRSTARDGIKQVKASAIPAIVLSASFGVDKNSKSNATFTGCFDP